MKLKSCQLKVLQTMSPWSVDHTYRLSTMADGMGAPHASLVPTSLTLMSIAQRLI